MNCTLPGSSVHGISQATILEWVAISFSRGCSRSRDQTMSPAWAGGFFTTESPGKPNGQILSCKCLLCCVPWVCVTWTWKRHSCDFGVLYLTKGSTGDPLLLSYLEKEFQSSSSAIQKESQISIQKKLSQSSHAGESKSRKDTDGKSQRKEIQDCLPDITWTPAQSSPEPRDHCGCWLAWLNIRVSLWC